MFGFEKKRLPLLDLANRLAHESKEAGESASHHLSFLRAMIDLDLKPDSQTLMRSPVERMRCVASLCEECVGKDELPSLTSTALALRSERFRSTYRRIIKEMYEVAALFDLLVIQCGDRQHRDDAIKFYEHYLYYARGNSDQQNRIKLAAERLKYIRQH